MNIREKFIALTDNDLVKKSDAIILLEGDGFSRINKAVELYKLGFARKLVFSGGINSPENGSIPFSEIYPVLLESGLPASSVIYEDKSQNTREQAVEVIGLARTMNWTKLILVASNYHQYRAYLTFLKELLDTGKDIILYNAPARELRWFEDAGYGNRFDLLETEFEKIEKYGKNGHLADYSDAIDYQLWKEQQA
jgi:uncharacterized SAM-binding protein YcdF (DUF218 family)